IVSVLFSFCSPTYLTLYYIIVYFFFQAEDGIRDFHVTGVQTCALPISPPEAPDVPGAPEALPSARPAGGRGRRGSAPVDALPPRSEERRVGKECRSRRWTDH